MTSLVDQFARVYNADATRSGFQDHVSSMLNVPVITTRDASLCPSEVPRATDATAVSLAPLASSATACANASPDAVLPHAMCPVPHAAHTISTLDVRGVGRAPTVSAPPAVRVPEDYRSSTKESPVEGFFARYKIKIALLIVLFALLVYVVWRKSTSEKTANDPVEPPFSLPDDMLNEGDDGDEDDDDAEPEPVLDPLFQPI